MVKKQRRFLKVFGAALLVLTELCGCMPQQPEKSHIRCVTEIVVFSQGEPLLRCDSAETMQPILDYLRLLSPSGHPSEDPEQATGEEFCIVLHFSDNTKKQYTQRCSRFLKIDSNPWQQIDPRKASALGKILDELKHPVSSFAPADSGISTDLLRASPVLLSDTK